MSRKEHIKKSLGITEYPWSSDEEDPASVPTIPEIMRRASEPRPSVAEMPGTSGQPAPSSPTLSPARRSGNKVDKDLILSILRNPHTHNMTPLEIVRSLRTDGAAPKAYVSSPLSWPSVVHTPAAELREARAERPNPTMDLARMVPFKRIARTISTIRSSKSNSNLYAMSSRGQRNPIFTPADMSGYRVGGRTPSALKRLQAERNSRRWDLLASKPLSTHHPQPEEPATSVAPVAPTPRDGFVPTQPSLREFMREAMQIPTPEPPPAPAPPPPDAAWMDETVVVDEASPNDQNDDVMELPDNVGSPQPIVDEAADPEPIDVDTSHNSSGAGVSLEEEIVEIDAPDDVDADVNVTGDGDDNPENVVTSDVGLNEAAAAPTNDDTVVLHQQSHESNKRRRDGHASAEEGEPYTVKEFNQSLLRLLECPVCLEWMEPPMSQCRRGHLVCSRCRARLASCPVCRTTFSSVRNRAMEGVAEMVRYPCRHGCGREVRLRRRAGHEASCGARRYHCPAPACADRPPLPRDHLHQHFQGKHMSMLKIGRKHKFSMKVNSEQHDTWLITALHEYFYLRVDVDIRTWGVIVYVAYIGPKCNAKNFTYEVSVVGQHNSRKLVYARVTHSDLESSNLNVSRQDCFHLTLDQALNFLRFKNRHCEPDKFLDFNVEINKSEPSETRDDSDS